MKKNNAKIPWKKKRNQQLQSLEKEICDPDNK